MLLIGAEHLVANAAVQILNRMLNHQKNAHADSIIKELANLDP